MDLIRTKKSTQETIKTEMAEEDFGEVLDYEKYLQIAFVVLYYKS